MKKILLTLSFLVIGCSPAGTSEIKLTGSDNELPEEIKGLKVYNVSTGNGGSIKVALLDKKVNSVGYKEGKHQEDVITLIDESCNCETKYHSRDILLENDSIIIIKKIWRKK
jgi:hypothetical protein